MDTPPPRRVAGIWFTYVKCLECVARDLTDTRNMEALLDVFQGCAAPPLFMLWFPDWSPFYSDSQHIYERIRILIHGARHFTDFRGVRSGVHMSWPPPCLCYWQENSLVTRQTRGLAQRDAALPPASHYCFRLPETWRGGPLKRHLWSLV